MTFQFLCPQGHLLEGEDSHMGMQCECPQCGVLFIIPTVAGAAPASESAIQTQSATKPAQQSQNPLEDLLDEFRDPSAPSDLGEGMTSGVVHIPCPNGHELETPTEWIGIEALCPFCGVQFRLKKENSVEYLQRQAIIDAGRAKFWFKWSIVAAVVVLGLLVLLMIFSALK